MKISLDTSTLINLCKNKDNVLNKFINYIKKKDILVFMSLTAQAEFIKGLTEEEKINFNKLSKYVTYDNQKYVTVGESVVGDPDIIPGSAFEGFNMPLDSKKAYLKSGSRKTIHGWIKKKQTDATVYSRAVDLGCDYLITENIKDFKGKDKKFKTKIINLNCLLSLRKNKNSKL